MPKSPFYEALRLLARKREQLRDGGLSRDDQHNFTFEAESADEAKAILQVITTAYTLKQVQNVGYKKQPDPTYILQREFEDGEHDRIFKVSWDEAKKTASFALPSVEEIARLEDNVRAIQQATFNPLPVTLQDHDRLSGDYQIAAFPRTIIPGMEHFMSVAVESIIKHTLAAAGEQHPEKKVEIQIDLLNHGEYDEYMPQKGGMRPSMDAVMMEESAYQALQKLEQAKGRPR